MKNTKASLRYAKALLELSVEQNKVEQIYADSLFINKILVECKDLVLLLNSPIIKPDKKVKILGLIFKNKVQETTFLFLTTITLKKRESLLKTIIESLIDLFKKQKNIEVATIKTAVKLDGKLEKHILSIIKEKTNGNIELRKITDKNIIGGAIITIGDSQIDASVSKKILELKQKFNKNPYIQDY